MATSQQEFWPHEMMRSPDFTPRSRSRRARRLAFVSSSAKVHLTTRAAWLASAGRSSTSASFWPRRAARSVSTSFMANYMSIVWQERSSTLAEGADKTQCAVRACLVPGTEAQSCDFATNGLLVMRKPKVVCVIDDDELV